MPEAGFAVPTTVGVIGAGRLGSSLAQAMAAAGYPVTAASTRRPEHARWLADRMPGATVTKSAQDVADTADAVFICVDDGSIATVCDSLRWRHGQSVIHCSGAQPLSVMGTADAQGAVIGGFHPLQTFPGPDMARRFSGIAFGVESRSPGLSDWMKRLAHDLGGETIEISEEARATYHASAVMACGLLAGLVGLSADMWRSLGVDRRRAVELLTPLVSSTVEGIGERGIPAAITGPYVRGDVETVQMHIDSTRRASTETGRAYAALALAALPYAAEQGGLGESARSQIESFLKQAVGEAGTGTGQADARNQQA